MHWILLLRLSVFCDYSAMFAVCGPKTALIVWRSNTLYFETYALCCVKGEVELHYADTQSKVRMRFYIFYLEYFPMLYFCFYVFFWFMIICAWTWVLVSVTGMCLWVSSLSFYVDYNCIFFWCTCGFKCPI